MDLVFEPLQRYARRRCEGGAVDDLVADTLLALWRRLDDVPPGQELPWSYRTAALCLANTRRAAGRQRRLRSRLETTAREWVDEPHEPDAALHAALHRLRPIDRELLRLWAWEELTTTEIATALDLTPNAVSIRLHRAKRRLAGMLEERKDPPAPGHVADEDQELLP